MPRAINTPMMRWAALLGPSPEGVMKACDRLYMRGKMGRPEEVAHVIVFLASNLASFVTGSAVAMEGGLMVAVGGMAFQEGGLSANKL